MDARISLFPEKSILSSTFSSYCALVHVGKFHQKLTFSQTHLSEMNPRRAKQVINTFPSLSCSNYCAIFHLYNVQFSTSLGVSSATCVRTFLRLPTIFSVLLSPPQGEAFDSDENGVACSIFPAFFEAPSQYIGPLLRFIYGKTTCYASFVTPFRRDSLTLMKESFIFETPSQCCFFADRPLAQDLTHPQEPTTPSALLWTRV